MFPQPLDHFDSTGHGVNPGSDIWPGDVLRTPSAHVELPWAVRAFVISPIRGPADEGFLGLIRSRVQMVAGRFDLAADAVRVDKIVSPGSIHQSIWENMRDADIIVCNLTGHNPNVIYELGVAAAYLPKTQVIILQESEDIRREREAGGHPIPFNLKPLQVITHGPDLASSIEALALLDRALEIAIARLPFERALVGAPPAPLSQEISFLGTDFPWLCVPHLSHRKVTAEGLELGNPRLFGASWASYGDLNFRNVRVTAQMKILHPFVDDPPNTVAWMGVGLRASHYYARYSHLVYLRRDGQFRRTEFLPTGDKVPDDPIILSLPAATSVENALIELSAEMRENVLSIGLSVDSSPLPPIPPIQIENYVFSRGRMLIQAYLCRVLLRSILVEEL